MLWYKHFNNFRNTAEAKMIFDAGGDRYFAAAIRLLEVMCEVCGSGEKFCPTLKLVAPTSKLWLGQEILSPRYDEADLRDIRVTEKETDDLLDCFTACGFIYRESEPTSVAFRNDKTGKWERTTQHVDTVTLGEFFLKSLETWTARQYKPPKDASNKKKAAATEYE